MKAIEINKEISKILGGIAGVSYYPLVIPENTPLPCVVYERSVNNDINNDSYTSVVNVSMDILTSTYSEGVELLNNILEASKGYGYVFEAVSEDYLDGVYIQKLTISKLITN